METKKKWREIARDSADSVGISKSAAEEVVAVFLGNVRQHVIDMSSDGKFRLGGLGAFFIKQFPARKVRNPRTGEEFLKGEHEKIKFKINSAFADM